MSQFWGLIYYLEEKSREEEKKNKVWKEKWWKYKQTKCDAGIWMSWSAKYDIYIFYFIYKFEDDSGGGGGYGIGGGWRVGINWCSEANKNSVYIILWTLSDEEQSKLRAPIAQSNKLRYTRATLCLPYINY